MKVLRTPDERFAGLSDFPYPPNYTEITDADGTPLRIHSVDAGRADAPTVLLMHGEPSWSYLYRHIILALLARGCRVIAPDLVGFGRSDKPAAQGDYSYERHVKWMSDWLAAQRTGEITLFCQDWGGLIGLRLVAAFPDRFKGVVVANTGLPTGTGSSPGFDQWLQFSRPSALFIDKNDTLFVPDNTSGVTRPGWPRGIRIGDAKDGKVTGFVPFPDLDRQRDPKSTAHGVENAVVDAEGSIYVVDVDRKMVKKFLKK